MSTAIQWTDVTDNIIVVKGGGWWCRKISPGCANCYAAKLNQSSFFGGNKLAYTGKVPRLKLRPEILASWRRQRQPKKHFVASMTDVFGDWVPREWIFQFLDAMWAAHRQTFQVLTKRADVMAREVAAWLEHRSLRRVPENIWLGVSVEDIKRKERLQVLAGIPAYVRFASFEPLLEDLNLAPGDLAGLRWAIIGGESGPGARPCALDWIAEIQRECRRARVPVFVKQLGALSVFENANRFDFPDDEMRAAAGQAFAGRLMTRDAKGGDMAEWPEDLRVREFPRP